MSEKESYRPDQGKPKSSEAEISPEIEAQIERVWNVWTDDRLKREISALTPEQRGKVNEIVRMLLKDVDMYAMTGKAVAHELGYGEAIPEHHGVKVLDKRPERQQTENFDKYFRNWNKHFLVLKEEHTELLNLMAQRIELAENDTITLINLHKRDEATGRAAVNLNRAFVSCNFMMSASPCERDPYRGERYGGRHSHSNHVLRVPANGELCNFLASGEDVPLFYYALRNFAVISQPDTAVYFDNPFFRRGMEVNDFRRSNKAGWYTYRTWGWDKMRISGTEDHDTGLRSEENLVGRAKKYDDRYGRELPLAILGWNYDDPVKPERWHYDFDQVRNILAGE